jgi:hypothetical protein
MVFNLFFPMPGGFAYSNFGLRLASDIGYSLKVFADKSCIFG